MVSRLKHFIILNIYGILGKYKFNLIIVEIATLLRFIRAGAPHRPHCQLSVDGARSTLSALVLLFYSHTFIQVHGY